MSPASYPSFALEAAKLALAEMFRSRSYFNICTVDSVAEALNMVLPRQEYNELRTLHYVPWSAMSPEMRQAVAERTVALFREPGLDAEALLAPFKPQPVPQRSGILAFLGKGKQ